MSAWGTAPADRFRAIVFDFDGTLARLTIDFAGMRTAVLDLIARYPIPTDGLMNYHILEMVEEARTRIARLDRHGASAFFRSAHALIAAIEMEAARSGSLFAGTEELLAELGRRGIGVAVVTRNCRAAVVATFPAIDRTCRVVLTRDDTARIKPHPAHLLAALRALGTDPADAAMVGDHPLDIRLGREAGTFTIGVLSGHSTREALETAGADLVLPDAVSLLNATP
ncbi:MAG: HAD family hydrolase [Syntrophales bacterium]